MKKIISMLLISAFCTSGSSSIEKSSSNISEKTGQETGYPATDLAEVLQMMR
ncbi:hypothetical protein [Butyrivibrio proteoclasticus]|uniref:hypothetical protein n=1 Tax=Butyrivibrio proteoclasticus TaxID=43305 RepID=UPI0012DFDB23|nr:hypothetical protein [Butyrivibrio proteoclasticus]